MGKGYSPDVIPDVGAQLLAGSYVMQINTLDDSQPTKNGKYQIKSQLVVVEPVLMAGTPFYENFVIGTDDDPDADDIQAWKGFAAGRYKAMLAKAGVELSGDVETDVATAVGQQVGVIITQRTEPATNKDGSPNAYAGRVRSEAQSFFRVGEKEPMIVGANGQPANPPPAAAPARAAAPAARPAAPVARPAPARAAAPAPAAAPAKPAVRPGAAKGLKCSWPGCGIEVPRSEFADHVKTHEAEEE